jgi:hypothetical protein
MATLGACDQGHDHGDGEALYKGAAIDLGGLKSQVDGLRTQF